MDKKLLKKTELFETKTVSGLLKNSGDDPMKIRITMGKDRTMDSELVDPAKKNIYDRGDSSYKPSSKPKNSQIAFKTIEQKNVTKTTDSGYKIPNYNNQQHIIDRMKKVRERYTVKLKNNAMYKATAVLSKDKFHVHKGDDWLDGSVVLDDIRIPDYRHENFKKQRNVQITNKLVKLGDSSVDSGISDPKSKNSSDNTKSHRKPTIKTIPPKKDTKVFKAVTFLDQKEKPNALKNKVLNNGTTRAKVLSESSPLLKSRNASMNPASIRDKPRKNKIKTHKKHTSPATTPSTNSPSRTDVAKWAPSCINHHTRPYYEAWVNTTLAAISRTSKKDKLYLEKHKFIKYIQKALNETPDPPDPRFFDIAEYTGKIKVTQR